jgi:hypothetical protein
MMERYSKVKRGMIESARIDDFLTAVLVVCREHGFSIEEDEEALVVRDYNDARDVYLMMAVWAGDSPEPAAVKGELPDQGLYRCSSCGAKALSLPLAEGRRIPLPGRGWPRWPHRVPEGWTLDEEGDERCPDCRRTDPSCVFEAEWAPRPELGHMKEFAEAEES